MHAIKQSKYTYLLLWLTGNRHWCISSSHHARKSGWSLPRDFATCSSASSCLGSGHCKGKYWRKCVVEKGVEVGDEASRRRSTDKEHASSTRHVMWCFVCGAEYILRPIFLNTTHGVAVLNLDVFNYCADDIGDKFKYHHQLFFIYLFISCTSPAWPRYIKLTRTQSYVSYPVQRLL